MNKLSEKDLLYIKEQSLPTKLRGSGSAWRLATHIPNLVDEILELRKEIKTIKEIHNYSSYGDWRDLYG